MIQKLIHAPPGRGNQGNALLVVMCVVVVLGIALASVLSLGSHENRILARTSAWNAALPVAEAGIEEALSHLQQVKDGPRGANGWQASGSSFVMNRYLTEGRYVAGISSATPPVILCVGQVWCPSAGRYIERTVQVTTTNMPVFAFAFASRFVIDVNGNGVAADSFDSTNPKLSTNGLYDPAKTSTNADVVSVFGPVDLGNDIIQGDLYLGPTAKFTSRSNQVSGIIRQDFNLDFPPVVPPDNFTTWVGALPLNLNIGGTVYKYAFLVGGDYTVADSANIYVAPNAKVRLRVTAANFSPNAIKISGGTNAPGKLTIYMAGTTTTMNSSSILDNDNAANFTYYGLTSNTSITYGGSSSFIGTIYAPNADLSLNGGGGNNGFIGSSITKSIKLNGHYDFHYDESLRKDGPFNPFTIASWREL